MPKFIVESVENGMVTLGLPNSTYRNSFKVADAAGLVAGERVSGVIRANAWKAEAVALGGNYVEPLFGRPRRMQGNVIAVNEAGNGLVVHVGYDVEVKLPEKYQAKDFPVGTRVGFDCLEVPVFEPKPTAVSSL